MKGACVAFLIDAPPTAWIARAARRVSAEATRTYVFELPDTAVRPNATFRAYASLDRRLSRTSGGDPFAAAAASELKPAVLLPVQGIEQFRLLATSVEVDIVVDLTSNGVLGANDVEAEVWALRHDDEPATSPFAIFDAFAAARPVCRTILVRRGDAQDRILLRTQSLIRRVSLQRTRAPIYWKSAALPARALTQQIGGLGRTAPAQPRSSPTLRELARLAVRITRTATTSLRDNLIARPSWSLAWRLTTERTAANGAFMPSGKLEPPGTCFYADPFLASDAGRHYLFYETYHRRLKRAELVARELNGTLGETRTVLSRPYHLSYPFVFRSGDSHYLLPESAEHRRVQLFRARTFPWTWHLDTTLLDNTEAYDPTLVEHEGRHFLFVAMAEEGADIDELHVFWADSLHGPYVAHPLNPVVSDVRRARPAGRIYREHGHLIRPAQDCARGYGSAVVLNEILRLTPEEYSERPLARISPTWHERALGTHTIDHNGSIEVLDVKTFQPRLRRRQTA
jgi:hypothetical protein